MIKVEGKTKKERMLFILEYLKNNYNINHLAITVDYDNNISCHYKIGNKKCIVGQFLPDDHPGMNYIGGIEQLLGSYPDILEHKNFKNLPLSFFKKIQSLHDTITNWNESGLSEIGLENYKILYNKYCK